MIIKVIKVIKSSVLVVVALFAFLLVISEESSANPMPLGDFMLMKLAALAALVFCLSAIGALNIKNLFKDEDTNA